MKKLHIYQDGTFAISDDNIDILQNGAQPIQSVEATAENLSKHGIDHRHLDNSKKD